MDRYKIIKSGIQEEWLIGCPVKVEKFNILLDNQINQNVIQIKYKALGNKTIKSVWVDVHCYDDAMDLITTVSDVAYVSVNAVKGSNFGDRQPISANTNSIGSIKVAVKKIVFADESVWRNERGEIGIILSEQPSLKEYYGELYDCFVTASYKIRGKFVKTFNQTDNYWQCTCGQVNTKDTINCIACGANVEQLKTISNPDYLKQDALSIETQNRLAEEKRIKAERGRIEKERIAAEKAVEENIKKENEKKLKRRKIKIVSVCILLILSYIAYYTISINKICGRYDWSSDSTLRSTPTILIEKTSPFTIKIFFGGVCYSGLYFPNIITFGTYPSSADAGGKFIIYNGYLRYINKDIDINNRYGFPIDINIKYDKFDSKK